MASSLLLLLSLSVVGKAAGQVSNGCNGSQTDPEQLHFNYAGEGGMMVSWNTATQLQSPSVRYGRDGCLDKVAYSDVSVTYPTSTTYNNHVLISGLEPDTVYTFAVHCAADNDTHQFKTSLAAGDSTPFGFAFFVDLGTMGPLGLTTYGQKAPLQPGETTTMQSLRQYMDQFDFLWQRESRRTCRQALFNVM